MATSEIRAAVCAHVFRNERAVALVIRHSDGEWQAVCGQHDHPEDCSDFEVVGLNHLIERQANLTDAMILPPGYMAEWSEGHWTIIAHHD